MDCFSSIPNLAYSYFHTMAFILFIRKPCSVNEVSSVKNKIFVLVKKKFCSFLWLFLFKMNIPCSSENVQWHFPFFFSSARSKAQVTQITYLYDEISIVKNKTYLKPCVEISLRKKVTKSQTCRF